ncbi:hypothetical protein PSCSP1h_00030 [Prochlorococcus phage P-SCSP1h]|nr:hypothetical protein PSCSP1a_00026 [Prochlorococcus phage P-SCSP1a]ULF49609.1 hypothetical protein PSCSP1c_00026 [Prochlorococcus phage P-SCSP1c]ULF49764.1 hypothetical protein PSCSP1h_00030 [Prochlorococcus phage P-SCSP1h]ULF49842.1 hypothetical protein PSCSP1k_00028 [Prochlorococcus phage P-SCSP1k]|tara:strand:- start:277 stop:570 length:294 start_codon:yes stop_codon:yes gene_type:complete
MALTEHIEYDKIVVVQPYAGVNVRKATVIKRDGVEIAGSRSFERYSLTPGYYNESDVFIETDLSNQPAEVSAICNAVWTDDVKAAWKAKLKEDKPTT